jgi:hypothetical protein
MSTSIPTPQKLQIPSGNIERFQLEMDPSPTSDTYITSSEIPHARMVLVHPSMAKPSNAKIPAVDKVLPPPPPLEEEVKQQYIPPMPPLEADNSKTLDEGIQDPSKTFPKHKPEKIQDTLTIFQNLQQLSGKDRIQVAKLLLDHGQMALSQREDFSFTFIPENDMLSYKLISLFEKKRFEDSKKWKFPVSY